MHEEEMVVALAAIIGLSAGVWTICRYCYLTFKAWQDTALKRDMVARGYTAREIIAVVGSKCALRPDPLSDVPPAKPIRQPAYG
jgi:hypothetical protein